MRISVVTVTFNCEETIAETLRSVNTQSYADVEHIVIDGMSTDRTVEIVKSLGERVAIVSSEKDRGIYDAMNKGLARASGGLVGFLNADDSFADDRVLEDMARVAQAGGADAVYGDLQYVNRDDTSRVVRFWRAGPFSAAKLGRGWMPPHPSFYVRSTLLARLGGFDASLRVSGDYDLMVRCFASPSFQSAYLERVVVRMRSGGASNGSLRGLLTKSKEDLSIIRRHRLGGLTTLLCKNVRKVPQLWMR